MVNAAIIFDNFGPYHLARIESLSNSFCVTAIERARQSSEYPWQREASINEANFECLTGKDEKPLNFRQLYKRLKRLFVHHKIDLAAIPGWSGRLAFASSLAATSLSIPKIVMSESTPFDQKRSSPKEWIKRRYLQSFSSALVGGTLHKSYLTSLGFKEEKIFLGYDVVDNSHFSEARKNIAHDTFAAQEPYFLASARFVPKKNLLMLLRCYSRYLQLIDAKDSQNLVIMGDGPLRGELERAARDLGIDSRLSMPGFIQYPSLPAAYRNASALIHISTTEQWGLVVNEAMASELPVVVSNRCGCVPELVQQGENGIIIDPNNPDDVVKAMLTISTITKDKRKEMARRSTEIISEWGPSRFANGFRFAAEMAISQPTKRPQVVDRVLIRFLGELCK